MAVGNSIAFWKGVRLWQMAGTLRPTPLQPAGQAKQGVSRRRAWLSNRSPSFAYGITVNSWVPAIAGDHEESKPVFSGKGRQATRQIYAAKTLELFVENSGVDKGLGQLAWVEDMTKYRTVTNTGPGGVNYDITTAAAPSGWEPTVGDYVAVVNPATGEGFVSPVILYGSGTVRVNAQVYTNDRDQSTGELTKADQAVNTNWYVFDCTYYFDKVKFLQMNDPPPGSPGEDRWSPQIVYTFQSESGIIYPATITPDFT